MVNAAIYIEITKCKGAIKMWTILAIVFGFIAALAIIEESINYFAKKYVKDQSYSPKEELQRLKEFFIKLWKKINFRKKASSNS
jgi:hypothetical protein